MRTRVTVASLALFSLTLLFAGCESMNPHAHTSMWASVRRASATIYPTKGNQVSGVLWFDETGTPQGGAGQSAAGGGDGRGVHIHGTISGLDPNSVHAMHIHEFGDQSSDDGSAAGGHYNPDGHPHGAPMAEMHHAGDLGNITADATGKATVDMTVRDISIAGLKDPIIGRAVVIHAKPDDFSQPVGNAGGRIGVGVIGIAKNTP